MISIDTEEYMAQGYIELPSALFLALAKIHEAHEAADVRAGFDHESHDRRAVWHVLVDDDERSLRYVIDEEGALLGIELGEPVGDSDDWDWTPVDYDPETWEVAE